MKKLILSLVFLLAFSISSEAQINIGKALKKAKDRAVEKGKEALDNKLREEIEQMKNGFDSTNFGYAFATFDNASFFEDRERFAKSKKVLSELYQRNQEENRTEVLSPIERAKNTNDVGQMFFASSRFKAAELAFIASQTQFTQEEDTNNIFYTRVLANRGLLYHSTGRYTKSEEFTKRALDMRRNLLGEKHEAYATSLNNLAMLYKDLGKYNEAEMYMRQALDILQNNRGNEAEKSVVICLNNQAVLLQTVGRYQEAENTYQKALSVADKIKGMRENANSYQKILINLALLYQDQKRYPEADKLYQKALSIKEKRLGTKHPDYAYILNNLAALYMEMQQYEEVEKLLKKALDIYNKKFGDRHPSYAQTLSNLGSFYRVQERNEESYKTLQEALSIQKEVLSQQHPQYNKTQEELALAYWQSGKTAHALGLYREVIDRAKDFVQRYFAPMSENEKANYWAKLQPTFYRFYNLAVSLEEEQAAALREMFRAHLATKAILLSSTNKIKRQILNSSDAQLISDYKQWISQKEHLAKLYTFSKEEIETQNINVDSLERATNDLEKSLSRRSNIFNEGINQNVPDYERIRRSLKSGEAAIDLVSFPQFEKQFTDNTYYAALIVKANLDAPQLVLLKNGKALDTKFFKYYRSNIKAKQEDKFSYKMYWEAIDKALGSDAQKVYLALDGVYNQVSLNTLKNPEKGSYLLEERSLIFLSKMRDLPEYVSIEKKAYKQKNAVLIGFPDYGNTGKIAPLPGTKTEVQNIKQLLERNQFETQNYLANEAKEGKVKAVKSPRILHIATHGFFLDDVSNQNEGKVFGIEINKARENPLLRAGLLFADAEKALDKRDTRQVQSQDNGILTAYEAMNMELDDTEIVLLSACETGLGDVKAGEGVYGLQRAIKVAGADALIMSLWTVSDEATQELMSRFYQNWLKSDDKVKAFEQAQKQLKEKFKAPHYWGAFVLIDN